MSQLELTVNKRDITGKKVRFLRRQGITPVHLFGHGIESLALQCEKVKLEQVLKQAGKATLISLKVDEEKKARSVVVRDVSRDPLKGELIHVDLYQVKMKEKVKMEIPIVLTGESPLMRLKGNVLMQELHALTVECLPSKIPTSVEVDISCITKSEETIRVKDIDMGDEVAVLNDPELVVVNILAQRAEKLEEEVPVAEAAVKVAEATAPHEEEAVQE